MADYWIKKVSKSDDGNIEEVKYSYSLGTSPSWDKNKSSVVNDIDSRGKEVMTAYKSGGQWKKGDSVHTVESEWIRTDGNEIESDNLGDLPEY